jgi:hypothetical protein
MDDFQRRPDPTAGEPVDVVPSSSSTDRTTDTGGLDSSSSRTTTHFQTTQSDHRTVNEPTARRLRYDPEALRWRRYNVGKMIDVVWYVLGVLEVVLALRFILKLTAANPAAGFVSLMYAISDPFVWLFNGIFRIPREGNAIFDANILIAMAVYALIGWGITRLLALTVEPPTVS